ncbi:RidA family protein [Pseudomonas sp. LP_7_YM]|uniref:RidA family protein n=1 Tax=Pseudomonas sp. LP_7_YM TaxID=2485137 RepID=UPI00105C24AD|nr:RidA family protein [Pseudomonas sp. LP_7_YM]TDV62586.1 enamine deaminase RidA (YjgF/YER057c/UK114 family) [Pseudomonas sp. LP_7_YM]
MSCDQQFIGVLEQLGYSFEAGLKRGGDYSATVRDGDNIYVSGQIPRIADEIVNPGRVGADISLSQAQEAATICALRCLALLQEQAGSLDKIKAIVRMTVFVQSADSFVDQSEVANSASHILHRVLGDAGIHTRTSVGVYQLPKNAPVEIDLIAVTK